MFCIMSDLIVWEVPQKFGSNLKIWIDRIRELSRLQRTMNALHTYNSIVQKPISRAQLKMHRRRWWNFDRLQYCSLNPSGSRKSKYNQNYQQRKIKFISTHFFVHIDPAHTKWVCYSIFKNAAVILINSGAFWFTSNLVPLMRIKLNHHHQIVWISYVIYVCVCVVSFSRTHTYACARALSFSHSPHTVRVLNVH